MSRKILTWIVCPVRTTSLAQRWADQCRRVGPTLYKGWEQVGVVLAFERLPIGPTTKWRWAGVVGAPLALCWPNVYLCCWYYVGATLLNWRIVASFLLFTNIYFVFIFITFICIIGLYMIYSCNIDFMLQQPMLVQDATLVFRKESIKLYNFVANILSYE